MSVVEKSIEVAVPIRRVYDQWTQFQSFPEFMDGVETGQWRGEIDPSGEVRPDEPNPLAP